MALLFTDKQQAGLIMFQIRKLIERIIKDETIIFGLMPSTKRKENRYTDTIQKLCDENGYEFILLKNWVSDISSEVEKLHKCNVLMLTGGNTYEFLYNLKRSGLDKEIIKFSKNNNNVILGFSAGALVLTPTIRILEENWTALNDPNEVGIKDLSGLGIIKEEVFPHYRDEDKERLGKYKKQNGVEVIPLKEDDFVFI